MDIKAAGVSTIQKGLNQISGVVAKLGSSNEETEFTADDAVIVSLSKLQVKAGAKLIKVSEELDKSTLSLLDK